MAEFELVDIAEMSRFLHAAVGVPCDPAPDRDAPVGDDANPIVHLTADLLLTARQYGLSNEESGCLFLLLATNLLGAMPSEALHEMVLIIRRAPARDFGDQ